MSNPLLRAIHYCPGSFIIAASLIIAVRRSARRHELVAGAERRLGRNSALRRRRGGGHAAARGPPGAGPRLASPAPSPRADGQRQARIWDASRLRSEALYPGQPWITDNHSSGTADAPKAAPTSPPAIAATVLASRPPRTAFSSDIRRTSVSERPSLGSSPGSEYGRCAIAHQAACRASTTQPLLLKSLGRDLSASTSRAAQTSTIRAGQVPQPRAGVEFPSQDGVPDGQAPEHARLAGRLVEVRERADGHRRLRQPVRVIEVGEGDRRGAHQRAVARRAPGPLVQVGRRRQRGGSRAGDAAVEHLAEHLAGLDADIRRGARPSDPAGHDLILGWAVVSSTSQF